MAGSWIVLAMFGVIASAKVAYLIGAKRKKEWAFDPIKHCRLYKNEGCGDVDGMLCNRGTCPYYGFKTVA